MKSIVAVIDWYGPYTIEAARSASKFDYDDGLYMVMGKTKGQKLKKLQYIGIASDLHVRLNGKHHAIPKVSRESEFWLGEVASPRTPAKKMKVTDRLLDLAEWAHVYLLELPLNTKKRSSPPDREIIVYNRWWKKNYETPYKKRPHKDWPDFLEYAGPDYGSKMVWFGSRQVAHEPE
ncbi:hypothetical protein BI364_08400 [Acidihalobacter yilgarnensis]|uniref:Uncharacterized protein n=1 Tax=Acidihalobacter yilgarnensis TaxID=2819280 RepID=A0A1D8IND9_9GAMM|nr:hypothetical protein [Acidihalobacter yilgarnensis]AOU97982.1 hypothetical protein BI364_08400 [Acidihalobacter yilgarnensis]